MKPHTSYARCVTDPTGRQRQCRTCHRMRYKHNRIQARIRMIKFLRDKSCVDCGERNANTFHMDHAENAHLKKRNLSGKRSRTSVASLHGKVLERELALITVRCANCHTKVTWPAPKASPCVDAERRRRGCCVDCGYHDLSNLAVFHFDHRDRGAKVMAVTEMARHSRARFDDSALRVEMAKCDLRCSSCHLVRTRKQLGWFQYPAPAPRCVFLPFDAQVAACLPGARRVTVF
jgi:hypothetical protein